MLANIAEGFGRGNRADRDRSLEISHGEADEVIQHLTTNFHASRIDATEYWPVHNKFVVIGKMANAVRNRGRRRRAQK